MPSDIDRHEQIPSRTTVDARLTLFTDAYTLTIINTCRNNDLDLLFIRNVSGTTAIRTFIPDNLTGTATIRTGLHVLNRTEQRLLREYYLPLTATFRTSLRRSTGLCTGTMTGRTLILHIQLDFLLTAKNGLLKGDADAGTQIGSLHRTSRPAAAPSAA